MIDSSFYMPTRMILGSDLFGHATPDLIRRAGSRALLLVGGMPARGDLTPRITEELEASGLRVILFDEISRESTSRAMEEAIRLARSARAQLVVAAGDVSSIWLGRCVARLAHTGRSIDEVFDGEVPGEPGIPVVELPLVGVDPFLFTDATCVVDARSRRSTILRTGEHVDTVLFDTDLAELLSEKETSYTVLYSMLLSLEGLFSVRRTFVAEPLFRQSFSSACALLRAGASAGGTAQTKAVSTAVLASMGVAGGSIGLGSALAFAIQGKTGLDYRWIGAILLPHVAESLFRSGPERTATIAEDIGREASADASPELLADSLRSLAASADVPMRLRELDILDRDVRSIFEVVEAMGILQHVPGSVDAAEVSRIIKRAF